MVQVYTSLISACSREILKISPDNRRLQLVLLERARGVLAEMRKSALRPDAILYNALITAAGRAGQVQGAFQTLEDMQVRPSPLLQSLVMDWIEFELKLLSCIHPDISVLGNTVI